MKIDLKVIKVDNLPRWKASDAKRPHIGGTGSCPAQAIGCMMLNHPGEIHVPLEFEWFSEMPRNEM